MILFSFDCYETLIEWEEGICSALKPVLKRHGVEMKREELLKLYSQIEPKLEKKYIPYRFVLKKVAENIFKVYSVRAKSEEQEILARSICSWKPLEDVREALVKIKKYGKIVVISSTDEDMIRASIEKNWSRF